MKPRAERVLVEQPLEVLVVDDVDEVRDMLRIVLDADPRFRVVGEASDGLKGVELAAALSPDLVLLDLVMPRLDGLEALPRLRESAPSSRVVMLSGLDTGDAEERARSLGAVGYLEKGGNVADLLDGLAAMAGALAVAEEAAREARSRLAPAVESAGSARQFVERTLEDWECEKPLEVVKLLVSELVTNAVVHAASDPEILVQLTPVAVHIEVLDNSPEIPVVRHPAPEETSGRGLALVQGLSTAWGVRPLATGKAVWFEVPR